MTSGSGGMQGRAAIRRDKPNICTMLQQPENSLVVSRRGCNMERGAALFVYSVNMRTAAV